MAPVDDNQPCPRCGTMLEGRRCKVLCPRCGYQEDCSDAGLIDYERYGRQALRRPQLASQARPQHNHPSGKK